MPFSPPRARRVLLSALAAALAVPAAAAAQSPITFTSCAGLRGFQCGTLTVPVDRADPAQGTVALQVRRLPHQGTLRGTIVFLAGGPGQSAISPGGDLEQQLRANAPGHEVVAFDQRGTGAGALRCPTLERSGDPGDAPEAVAALIAGCAAEIGPRRVRFTTAESVADLEDLRIALGRERITPFGVSYGTLVATWYARLHGASTAGLILDSVVGLRGNMLVDRDGYAAARRALAELCAARRCAGVTADPVGDVARLETRLAAAAITGRRVLPSGRTVAASFGGPDAPTALYELLGGGDLNADARGAFPAAVKLALRGDPALLFRIQGAGDDEPSRPRDFSLGLFLATECAEAELPWTPAQSTADRLAAATAALGATDPAVSAPFRRPGTDAALVTACLGWPESPAIAPPATPPPDVPALLIAGTQDIRTPLETARAVAATLPRASVVRAVGSGHSSISARNECTLVAIRRFIAGSSVGQPCRAAEFPDIQPLPAAGIAGLRPLGAPGRRGRTVRAVIATFGDITQALSFGTESGNTVRFTGLRGGRGGATIDARGIIIRFTNYIAIPGVVVTGTIRREGLFSSTATLRVSGPAASRGVLRLDGPSVTGTLDGRRISFTR